MKLSEEEDLEDLLSTEVVVGGDIHRNRNRDSDRESKTAENEEGIKIKGDDDTDADADDNRGIIEEDGDNSDDVVVDEVKGNPTCNGEELKKDIDHHTTISTSTSTIEETAEKEETEENVDVDIDIDGGDIDNSCSNNDNSNNSDSNSDSERGGETAFINGKNNSNNNNCASDTNIYGSIRSVETDCESLVTVNIDKSHTNSSVEEGVVFMGWNTTATTTGTTTSTDHDNNNNSTMNKNSNSHNTHKSGIPKSSRLGRTQSSEKPKKNRWQEILASNARGWRSPNKKGNESTSRNERHNNRNRSRRSTTSHGDAVVNPDEEGDSSKSDNDNENDASPFLLDEQQEQQQPFSIPTTTIEDGDDDNNNDLMDETVTATAVTKVTNTENSAGAMIINGRDIDSKDLKVNTSDHNSNSNIADTTGGGGGEEVKPQSPQRQISPPSLGFNSNYNASTAVPLGFPSSPSKQQRKKPLPFGRNKTMKIQSRKVKPVEQARNIMNDDAMMQKQFVQIKPFYAYPEGFQMSNSELYLEMMRKSSNVEMLQSTNESFTKENLHDIHSNKKNSQQIGSLKVEVLSCTGLPQFRRNKPNSITYVVCGDCAFATDVIHSSHSPMWPARSKRAAVFPLFHAYARLYTGVFNITDKDNDDYAGRSVVDIATLRPNISYDVSLPLRTSAIVYDRQPRGVVRLRFYLTWNNDRDAILSYLPKKMGDIFVKNEESADLVTIPCADPKSLRNVAFTVHGEDLPGKYSKKAFRAINREMNLYKFQTPIVFRRTLLNLMAYEKPIASTYIFIGWMAILYYRVYHLVPSYLMSLLIVVHLSNYHDLVSKEETHSTAFEPLSLREIFDALVHGSVKNEQLDYQVQQCSDNDSYLNTVNAIELPVEDHVEFPFSESKYKRLSLKHYLCPKVPNKKRHTSNSNDSIDDSSCNTADRESGESDNDSNSDRDEKSDDKFNSNKLIPSGPEQDDLVETRENTFQENLKQIENVLHSLTGDLFHEQISRSIPRSYEPLDNTEKGIPGLQVNKFTNPLAVLSAAFLEPVMTLINVYLLAVRSVFNLTHWRDPYLSFWILVVMLFFMIAFALFPWRSFFFCTGVILFGPQNFILKKISLFGIIFGEVSNPEKTVHDGDQSDLTNKKRTRFKRNRSDEAKSRNVAQCEYRRRPLFSTQHGLRQIKRKNAEPLEIVVPYARTRRERFYFWPPYSLLSQKNTPSDDLKDNSIKKKIQ